MGVNEITSKLSDLLKRLIHSPNTKNMSHTVSKPNASSHINPNNILAISVRAFPNEQSSIRVVIPVLLDDLGQLSIMDYAIHARYPAGTSA